MRKLSLIFLISILSIINGYSKTKSKSPRYTVTHVTLTYYQPVKSQCDRNPTVTSDGSKIHLGKLKSGRLKWCAISRDLLYLFPSDSTKPKRVWIEGFGTYEVRDVMNKRCKHAIDILIHPRDSRRIRLDKVKIKILK
jgi:3D (Asp-Asp-Asp) domain-containing protein